MELNLCEGTLTEILLALCPASLTHKNPQRRRDRLIDLKMFFVEYSVCVISVAVLVAVRRIFLLVFVMLDNRRSIFSFSKLQYSVSEFVLRLTFWLHKEPGTRVFERGLNGPELRLIQKKSPGLTITICNKITALKLKGSN